MIPHWDVIIQRHAELGLRSADPLLSLDERRKIQKELSFLDAVLKYHDKINELESERAEAQKQATTSPDEDMRELFALEVADLDVSLRSSKAGNWKYAWLLQMNMMTGLFI